MADPFGLWSPEGVRRVLERSAIGRAALRTVKENPLIRIKKSKFVRSYYRDRANETAEWSDWKPHLFGGMTTRSQGGMLITIHIPESFTDEQVASIVVHEVAHARGEREPRAYKDETQFALEAGLEPRPGFVKMDENGNVVVDEEAIDEFFREKYEGWYDPSATKEWKKDEAGHKIIEYGEEADVTEEFLPAEGGE